MIINPAAEQMDINSTDDINNVLDIDLRIVNRMSKCRLNPIMVSDASSVHNVILSFSHPALVQ